MITVDKIVIRSLTKPPGEATTVHELLPIMMFPEPRIISVVPDKKIILQFVETQATPIYGINLEIDGGLEISDHFLITEYDKYLTDIPEYEKSLKNKRVRLEHYKQIVVSPGYDEIFITNYKVERVSDQLDNSLFLEWGSGTDMDPYIVEEYVQARKSYSDIWAVATTIHTSVLPHMQSIYSSGKEVQGLWGAMELEIYKILNEVILDHEKLLKIVRSFAKVTAMIKDKGFITTYHYLLTLVGVKGSKGDPISL